MTESEKTKKAIYSLGFIKGILYNGIFADRIDCIDYAISALEEILEYRRIGSLIECRDAMELWKARQELDAKIERCMEYEKIGTVEECREAVEKRKTFCDSAEKYADGKCIGYGKSEIDDEPCEICKGCNFYVGYGELESEEE